MHSAAPVPAASSAAGTSVCWGNCRWTASRCSAEVDDGGYDPWLSPSHDQPLPATSPSPHVAVLHADHEPYRQRGQQESPADQGAERRERKRLEPDGADQPEATNFAECTPSPQVAPATPP